MVETGNQKRMFHPSTKVFRFSVLLFTSLLTFGTYFAYDIIGAIAPSLVERLTKYEVTNATLDSLMVLGFPYQVTEDLGKIKNQQIEGKETFIETLHAVLSPEGSHYLFHKDSLKNQLYPESAEGDQKTSPLDRVLLHAGGHGVRKVVGGMYTMYSIAAILFVFIGGILIDRMGTRKASMIFS